MIIVDSKKIVYTSLLFNTYTHTHTDVINNYVSWVDRFLATLSSVEKNLETTYYSCFRFQSKFVAKIQLRVSSLAVKNDNGFIYQFEQNVYNLKMILF